MNCSGSIVVIKGTTVLRFFFVCVFFFVCLFLCKYVYVECGYYFIQRSCLVVTDLLS